MAPKPLPETGAECGIDLGLSHFAVLDDGTKVSAPRFLHRAEKKLRKTQKDLSRKLQGSRNSTWLAKSVHDAGWSAFTGMLEYRAKLYGREFRKIGRFEPTSQVCSACGAKDGPKSLQVRQWACAACGTVHDRDVNAAKKHPRPGTQGEPKRPWRLCKTTARGGCRQ